MQPLYARIMGDAWLRLAEPIRELQSTPSTTHARGYLSVAHGRHRLARVLVRQFRLPHVDTAAPAELTVTSVDGCEHWFRRIGERTLETWLSQASPAELTERYGCLEFRFLLRAAGESLHYVQRGAALRFGAGRLRLPEFLAPRVEARETAAGPGQVCVTVSVTLPVIGLMIEYAGTVGIAEAAA